MLTSRARWTCLRAWGATSLRLTRKRRSLRGYVSRSLRRHRCRAVSVAEINIRFVARPYQQDLINFFRGGSKKACAIWHRKAGKDRTATFIESELAFENVGLYWHALPKYEEARKVIWDAIMPDGQRLVE